jgi:hypothetical protein
MDCCGWGKDNFDGTRICAEKSDQRSKSVISRFFRANPRAILFKINHRIPPQLVRS